MKLAGVATAILLSSLAPAFADCESIILEGSAKQKEMVDLSFSTKKEVKELQSKPATPASLDAVALAMIKVNTVGTALLDILNRGDVEKCYGEHADMMATVRSILQTQISDMDKQIRLLQEKREKLLHDRRY